LVDELKSLAWAAREVRFLSESVFKDLSQSFVSFEQFFGDTFEGVGAEVLFLLKECVEESPPDKGISRSWFEGFDDIATTGLFCGDDPGPFFDHNATCKGLRLKSRWIEMPFIWSFAPRRLCEDALSHGQGVRLFDFCHLDLVVSQAFEHTFPRRWDQIGVWDIDLVLWGK